MFFPGILVKICENQILWNSMTFIGDGKGKCEYTPRNQQQEHQIFFSGRVHISNKKQTTLTVK